MSVSLIDNCNEAGSIIAAAINHHADIINECYSHTVLDEAATAESKRLLDTLATMSSEDIYRTVKFAIMERQGI